MTATVGFARTGWAGITTARSGCFAISTRAGVAAVESADILVDYKPGEITLTEPGKAALRMRPKNRNDCLPVGMPNGC